MLHLFTEFAIILQSLLHSYNRYVVIGERDSIRGVQIRAGAVYVCVYIYVQEVHVP